MAKEGGGFWGGLFSAAAALGGEWFRSQQAKKQMAAQNAANKQLAQYQFDKNVEMWEMQNRYNSPEAQMARLSGAGLNPNLVYGSGVTGNQSGPAPSYSRPEMNMRYEPFNLPMILGQYQDFQMRRAQIDAVKANAENTRSRTISEGLRSMLLDIQGKKGSFELERGKALLGSQMAVAQGQARSVNAKVEQEYTRLAIMRREELLKLLEAQQRERQMSIMDVKKEQYEADLVFQRYKNEWIKAGVTTSDHPFLRILVRMWNESGLSGQELRKNVKGAMSMYHYFGGK